LYLLGQRCREIGREDLWRQAVTIAFSLPHRTPRQIFERGQAKLLLGDWSGWTDREARLLNPEEPVWRNESWVETRWTKVPCDRIANASDQVVFVIADCDDATCIQMLRFIPVVAERFGKVILSVSAALLSFVKHNVGTDLITVTFRHIEHALPFTCY